MMTFARRPNLSSFAFSSVALTIIAVSVVGGCKKKNTQESTDQTLSIQEQIKSQPNIILIMADDLGINELGCYGSKVIETPNIDQLCRTGIKFNNAYSGSTVCAPARCSLLTGRQITQCSVRVNSGGVSLPKQDVTMAELLKSAGYQTGGFGKWALGVIGSEGDPQNQGFDEFYGYYHQTHAHSHYPEFLVDNGKRIRIDGNIGAELNNNVDGFISDVHPNTGKELVYAPYLLMDRAKTFIRKNSNSPFFCYLPVTLPHGHFQVPASDPNAKIFASKYWSPKAKAVAAMTQLLDQQVGELVQLLDELSIRNNTMIVFCSDHGAAMRFDGELDGSGPYKGFKRSMYEGGLRVPLVVNWPAQIKQASESDHACYLGDLFATFKQVACLDDDHQHAANQLLSNQTQSSISILPTLLGRKGQKRHKYLLWEFSIYNPAYDTWTKRMQAIRAGRWKILRHADDQPWELYDLETDPYEQKNLAEEKKGRVKYLEEMYLSDWVAPGRQHELMVDWTSPFNWSNRLRLQRFPVPPIDEIIRDSTSSAKDIEFDNDAVLLGAIHRTSKEGLVQIDIAWQLKKGRRAKRFIHVLDPNGQVLYQHACNRTQFETAIGNETMVDSFVLKPEQLAGASSIAVGFFEAERGASPIKDEAGKTHFKWPVAKLRP